MRKYYPYLQEQYMYNLNEEQNKRDFLKQLDNFAIQKQYIQITLLDWKENPIKEIQGELTGGSLSKDGNNCVRTVGSLNCTVSAGIYSVDSLKSDFSLNKKVFIEIGIRNDTDAYKDWPILWFPQGVFIITDFSLNSSSTSAVNLTISIKDKMCLLNGDVGGKLPSYVQFDVMDTQAPDGTFISQKVLIYNIILELLNHFGGEDLNNIIIQDVPFRIKQVMKWNGSNKLYGTYRVNDISDDTQSDVSTNSWDFSLNKPDKLFPSENVIEYEQNTDVGYIYSDFVFIDELAGNIGESITSVLDKIKNYLGNYEYFYNEFGIFIFREIKNYLNTTQAQVVQDEMTRNPIKFAGGVFYLEDGSENQYLIETINEKTLYAFNDDSNITSITVTPQYGNIKNDYIVTGMRPGDSSDTKYIIKYRLAIDNKPDKIINSNGEYYYLKAYENVVYYYDESDHNHKLGIGTLVDALPNVGNWDKIYLISTDYKLKFNNDNDIEIDGKLLKITNNNNLISIKPLEEKDNKLSIDKSVITKEKTLLQKTYAYKWDGQKYIQLYSLTDSSDDTSKQIMAEPSTYYPKDWRTALYLYGLLGEVNGTDKGAYYEDLSAFWPQEYCLDPNHQQFFVEQTKDKNNSTNINTLSNGNFYLDFIDAEIADLGEYSIDNIGRREDVVSNDDINCLFLPEIPNIVFLNKDNPRENWSENTASIVTDEELIDLYKKTMTEKNTSNNIDIENITLEDMMLKLQRNECEENAQPWTQVGQEIYSNLSIGGQTNSAYEQIRYELFCHTRYQKTISITSIPVYYLYPNSRIQLESKSTNTYGDFMVQSISLTFGPGANMSVVLNEAMERL